VSTGLAVALNVFACAVVLLEVILPFRMTGRAEVALDLVG